MFKSIFLFEESTDSGTAQCISEWLLTQRKNSCPYCRKELFPPQEDDSYASDDEDFAANGLQDGDVVVDEAGNDHRIVVARALLHTSRTLRDITQALMTRAAREHQLYGRLLRGRAQLPPLSVEEGMLSSVCMDAMFRELRQRGAFDIPALHADRAGLIEEGHSDMANEHLMTMLRARGFVWRPQMIRDGVVLASGWSTGDGEWVQSADNPHSGGQLIIVPWSEGANPLW